MELHYKTYDIPFEHPFTISNGITKTHQSILLVALRLGNWMGFGEATAIAYYDVSIEKMLADLERFGKMIAKFAFTEPERYWHYLHHLLPNNPFLVATLDMAGWDLYGQMKGKKLHELWQTEWQNLPLTDYTIGIDSPEKMLAKMQAKPWPIYKVKLGTPNDLAIIKVLRQHTNAKIRVDANAGWTLEEALQLIPALEKLQIELIEQPLAKDNWEGMQQLMKMSSIPLIADESCVFEQDVAKCIGHFHGINIKLTKCSGITPALIMIAEAKKAGMKVMMGSMNENVVGSAAIAHFLPQLDYVDMDGPLLQTKLLADGLVFENGSVAILGNKGLGLTNIHW